MKILSVLLAQSMKAVRQVGGDFGYLPDASKLLVEKYGFVGVPTTRDEILPADESKGVTFRHGKCALSGREIVIDFFQIYQNGLLVTTHTNTADADLVLEDAFRWAVETFNYKYELVRPAIVHNSQLEVRFERSLPKMLPALSSVGNSITSRLDDFWDTKPQYEPISLAFWFDKSKFPSIAPNVFRLARREGAAFDKEIYWSEAPLSTEHHIEVLNDLEKTLS
jgi:hypothetical protein